MQPILLNSLLRTEVSNLAPVVRVELGVGPVPLVRLGKLQACATAAAVAHVEGVVHGGSGCGRGEGEAGF